MANAILKLTSHDLGIYEGSPAHKYFTQRCYDHMAKYTPGGETGQIHRSAFISIDEIAYTHPGAHYQWYGEVMGPNIPIKTEDGIIWRSPKGKPKYYTGRKIHNLTGGSHWEEKMWIAEGNSIVDEVETYIQRRYL